MKNEIFSPFLKHNFRVTEKDFSRNRKQSFSTVLLFMMNLLRKSLAIEIDNFVNFIHQKCASQKTFTQSAFVQARKKIKPAVFKKLSQTITNEFYSDNDEAVKLWKGFRLLAVDGSRITLPITDELEAIYGQTKNQTQTSIVQGRCSVLYDVENNYVIDAVLAPLAKGERALAKPHFQYCKSGDLLVYDRGYPSYEFINEHIDRGLDYLMRIKVTFSQTVIDFELSKKKSQVLNFFPGKNAKLSDKPYGKNTPIKVRLVRVELPSGQVEILVTSLLESKTYPTNIFKALYAKRWGVET
ncbi:MAG: IS4 family transposase, partial [Desulfonauticus sp.]|nr:IS4 family transposase [Desulfonauticus sp.]